MKVEAGKTSSARIYRPDIDGLRSIAIVSVVLYHAGVPWISGGFTGVDIFFVISGYLIGGHIFSDLHAGGFSFLNFYRLRAKRILPAFYAMLAIITVAALFLLSPFEAQEFGKSALTATLSVSNIYFWRHSSYFDTQNTLSPMLMTWSLGVEEQFYAVIPVLMVLLARVRRNLVLPLILIVCVVSFAYACFDLPTHPTAVFYFLPARAWELGVGVALAVAGFSKKRTILPALVTEAGGILGAALMLVPVFMLTADSHFPGQGALSTVLGTALIIALPQSWVNRRLLSFPALVFIGRISYSWYLWHWPLLAFIRVVAGGSLPPVPAAGAVAVSLGLAIASYFFIEQPFRKSRRAPAPLLIRYALLSSVFLAACAGIWLTHGIPRRFPNLPEIDNAKEVLNSDACMVREGTDKPNHSQDCYPSSTSRPAVALWGDSHAAALAPALRQIANSEGYELVRFNKSFCRPLGVADDLRRPVSSKMDECLRFNRFALDQMQADRRVRIVIIANAWGHVISQPAGIQSSGGAVAVRDLATRMLASNQDVFRFLEASISLLQRNGKQVILLDDVPTFDLDPTSLVWTGWIPVRRAIADRLGLLNRSGSELPSPMRAPANALATTLLKIVVSDLPGTTMVDTKRPFCGQNGQCAFREGGTMLYLDPQHLTPDGARLALEHFHLRSAAPGDGG